MQLTRKEKSGSVILLLLKNVPTGKKIITGWVAVLESFMKDVDSINAWPLNNSMMFFCELQNNDRLLYDWVGEIMTC